MAAFRFEAWPTEHRVVTQYFGANPENYAQFGLPGHEGVDIRAPNGSRVFAVAPGEVIRAHNSPRGHNYGIHVRLAHAEGYETTYAHLESLAVSQGQVVSAGDLLGRADNTGNSFGAHLHLTLRKSGVRHGRWPPGIIDPLPFLLPLLGWQRPTGPFVEGWVMSAAIMQNGDLAQANEGGVTLYVTADYQAPVPTGTMMIVTGQHEPFARVQVPRAAVGLEDETPPQPAPEPPPTLATVDGWAWADFLTVVGSRAVVGPHGVHVRAEPRREARNLGLLAAGSSVTLLGESRNNFHPIRASRGDFLDPVLLPDRPPAGNGTGP